MVHLKFILVVFLLKFFSYAFARRSHSGPNLPLELQGSSSSAATSNAGLASVNGTLFQTVKRYHCAWKGQGNVTASTLLLYGSKAWTFPNQDVQLELTYPEFRDLQLETIRHPSYSPGVVPTDYHFFRDLDKFLHSNSTESLVTMFDVILRIGGVDSAGYITAGGILQEFITLSFFFSNISSLEYEFWLYGVPKWSVDPFDQFNNQLHELC